MILHADQAVELDADDVIACMAMEVYSGHACRWHGACVDCGDLIHLGAVDEDMGMALAIAVVVAVGDPPRCPACRTRRLR